MRHWATYRGVPARQDANADGSCLHGSRSTGAFDGGVARDCQHGTVGGVVNVRAQIAMTAVETGAFLAAGRTGILVSIGPDGLPDPVPMWYVVDAAGRIRMRTYAASQKVANLRRDPRVCCLVEDGDRYVELRGVQLTGRVELVEDPDWIAEVVVGLAVKYEGLEPEHVEAVRESARNRAGKQVGLLLHVDHTVSWDHAKINSVQR